MAIQARLEGGPRDGETLSLTEEVLCIDLLKPKSIYEAMERTDFDPCETEDIYRYVLYRILPNEVRIYRCGYDQNAATCDQTATKR